ncbi:helix-turn-helix domain-containing protein [Streptomyces sp. Tue6028]|uniref:helix-turn-helix domain-containing protein n=1 Tax=Streptomyces sp. Tue6028 TaxID=2036037 RepID=UPI003D743005
MPDFDAIGALLARAKKDVPLPPAEERRALREGLNLSRPQLAQALNVSPPAVGGWESGRDPSGEVREKYAYFLAGARTKLAAVAKEATPSEEPTGVPTDAERATGQDDLDEVDDVVALPAPQPCVLCAQPALHQVAGFPQHLNPAECGTSHAAQTVEPAREQKPAPRPKQRRPSSADQPHQAERGLKVVPVGRRLQTTDTPDLIGSAVETALTQHAGDVAAATEALVKRAIPDAMALLDHSRTGGRYDVIAHPWLPDILCKQTSRGADQIWEARPKWVRPELPPGKHAITALDMNGAYLSTLKTHLPLGQLEHPTGNHHDRRRAGLHLITPPDWDHNAYLPNPIGKRDEPGPLWATEPTLRLLLRISGPRYGLCDLPEIHESWTSGATEGLLEKFRVTLKDARDTAIAEDDDVTLEYVKQMYSKFVSTLGESNYNRELYRTDWMHLIRSQAFANLWWKAHRAYDEGLTVVRVMGTDELHVTGDWRAVFPEGRGVAEAKVKDRYTVGAKLENAREDGGS